MLCDPGSELRLGGRENRRAKIINGTETKNEKQKRRFEPMSSTLFIVVLERRPAYICLTLSPSYLSPYQNCGARRVKPFTAP